MRKTYFLILLGVGLFSGGCYRSQPLYTPSPIAVVEPLSSSEVGGKVKAAAKRRGWEVVSEKPGSVVLELGKGRHGAQVQADYNEQDVNLKLLNAKDLNYQNQDGNETVHARFNVWMRNLEADIRSALQ